MSDMKGFLEGNKFLNQRNNLCIDIYDLGLFFWKRGGRKALLNWKTMLSAQGWDFEAITNFFEMRKGKYGCEQDFLDCLACLGEEQVKELIEKEVKQK